MKYSKSQWLKWDTYATLKYARDEGFKEGFEEGFEDGFKEGLEEERERVREEARERGREEVKAEVIKNLLSAGKFTVSELADMLKVPEAFVEKIKASLP